MERNRSDDTTDRSGGAGSRSGGAGPAAGRRPPAGAAILRPEVTEALIRALFLEWAQAGYAALSLERVARRAGVGKAALYRRWPSKAAMASDALSTVGLTITDVPDTGSLRGDISAVILSIRRVLRHPVIRRIVLDLHAEMARSPDLERAVRPFQAARRARVDLLVDRAVTRGELRADVDREIAADLLGALPYWRMAVVRGPAALGYVRQLTAMIAAALEGG